MIASGAKQLPFWSRAIIALVVLAIVGSIGTAAFGTIAFKQKMKDAQNPQAIGRLAKQLLGLPESLPSGKYLFGADVWLLQIFCLDFDNGKQRLIFILCPAPDDNDPQKQLTLAYEQGMPTVDNSRVSFSDLLVDDSWTFNGTKVPYRIGKLSGADGTGLVACAIRKKDNKAVLLYAIQPKGETFEIKACSALMQAIAEF